MILPLVALSILSAERAQVGAVRLARGIPIASSSGVPRYDDVAEAILDAKTPDEALPLEYGASVGPSRALLIRFGSLDGVVPAGARVTGATLVLTSADGQALKIRSVRRLTRDWVGAGPTALARRLKPKEAPPKRGSASLRSPGAGRSSWNPLAADSRPIEGASVSADAKEARVSGLAATVQEMADRPGTNDGFVLQFESEGYAGSSLSPTGRPALEIEYDLSAAARTGGDLAVLGYAPSASGLTATVANLGAAPLGGRAVGTVEGKSVEAALAPLPAGGRRDVELPLRLPAAGRIVIETRSDGDVNPRNDGLVSELGGARVGASTPQDVERTGRLVRTWNAEAAASRYSFALDGPAYRLTFIGLDPAAARLPEGAAGLRALSTRAGLGAEAAVNLDASTMPPLPGAPKRGAADRFAGLSGGGDTRTDAALPPTINLPPAPSDDPLFRRLPLESLGGLSLTDVARLQAAGGALARPRSAIVRVLNSSGRPLTGLALELYPGDGKSFPAAPAATVTTTETGIAILPASVLTTPILAISASSLGEREVGFVKDWQLLGAAVRGNLAAPLIEVRLNLPTLPVARDVVLSSGKFVTDSLGSSGAALGTLLDDDPKTTFSATYPPGGFIEVDLGRDRTLAEVQLVAEEMPAAFDVRLRMTGEEAGASGLWTSELDWPWTRANRPDDVLGATGVVYRGTAQRGRYLRIVLPVGGSVRIATLRALAAKIASP